MSQKELKGVMGELGVCKHIEALARTHYVKYIHNLPFKSVHGFQQIDVAILSTYGFYALEVKNWNCKIFCSLRDYYWTAEYHHRDIVFRSPIQQNLSHVRYMKNLTGYPFKNLVVFPDTTVLVNKLYNTLYLSEIIQLFHGQQECYTREQVDEVYEKLLAEKATMEPYMLSELIFSRMEDKRIGRN